MCNTRSFADDSASKKDEWSGNPFIRALLFVIATNATATAFLEPSVYMWIYPSNMKNREKLHGIHEMASLIYCRVQEDHNRMMPIS